MIRSLMIVPSGPHFSHSLPDLASPTTLYQGVPSPLCPGRFRHARPPPPSFPRNRLCQSPSYPLGEGGRRPEERPVPNTVMKVRTPLPLGEGGRRPGEGETPITLPLPPAFIAVDTGLLATRFPHPNPLPEGEGAVFDTAWKAGIQGWGVGALRHCFPAHPTWIPAFAGMTEEGGIGNDGTWDLIAVSHPWPIRGSVAITVVNAT